MIGADGVHSTVREIILGHEKPINKGRVAYRAVFPASLMNGKDIGPSRTKWWGPDRHIVIYYTNADRSEIYFVTSLPEPLEWMTRESWSAKGDVKELRAAYAGFHPDVRAVLEACPDCHKWAILEREPLARWSDGRVVLLGDACHPDDTLHGAGRRDVDRGRGDTRALSRSGGRRRHRRRAQALRGAPQAAHFAHPGDLEREHVDAERRAGHVVAVWI